MNVAQIKCDINSLEARLCDTARQRLNLIEKVKQARLDLEEAERKAAEPYAITLPYYTFTTCALGSREAWKPFTIYDDFQGDLHTEYCESSYDPAGSEPRPVVSYADTEKFVRLTTVCGLSFTSCLHCLKNGYIESEFEWEEDACKTKDTHGNFLVRVDPRQYEPEIAAFMRNVATKGYNPADPPTYYTKSDSI